MGEQAGLGAARASQLVRYLSQLAMALAARRQDGILTRVRATPLPAWTYFVGLLVHGITVSLIHVSLIAGIGRLYGVPFPTHWPAIAWHRCSARRVSVRWVSRSPR